MPRRLPTWWSDLCQRHSRYAFLKIQNSGLHRNSSLRKCMWKTQINLVFEFWPAEITEVKSWRYNQFASFNKAFVVLYFSREARDLKHRSYLPLVNKYCCVSWRLTSPSWTKVLGGCYTVDFKSWIFGRNLILMVLNEAIINANDKQNPSLIRFNEKGQWWLLNCRFEPSGYWHYWRRVQK